MATGRPVLILALAAALAGATGCERAPVAGPACVRCHAVHDAEAGTCVDCHLGNDRAARAAIAHDGLLRGAAAAWREPGSRALSDGERLRDSLGCRRCHLTGGRGNAWAIALDRVVWRRSQEQLRQSLRSPASFMPDFSLSLEQADELIAVLLRDGDRAGAEERYMVRFREAPEREPEAFVMRCGGCHRALTRSGPLGSGDSGPNLTGLFTEFYPSADGRRWDRDRLARWIRNPRAEKPEAVMPPVRLRDDELAQILATLAAPPLR